MQRNPCLVIAKYTFLEAYQDRLFLQIGVLLLLLFSLNQFIASIAIIEQLLIYNASFNASLRLATVFVVGLFVSASINRERQHKCTELILSCPLSKAQYYIGKFLGFNAVALIIVGFAGLLLVWSVDIFACCYWLLSLICELSIIIAISLFCALTFRTTTTSFGVTMIFYIAARLMHTIFLLSKQPILGSEVLVQKFITAFIYVLDLLLPNLHQFTKTNWLLYDHPLEDLGWIILQTVIYLLFISMAAVFDLSKKEI